MTHKEALNKVKGYLTDIIPAEDYSEVEEIMKALEQEPKYCDRNICLKNEYSNIGCDECEVTKSQEPCNDCISRQAVLNILARYKDSEDLASVLIRVIKELPPAEPKTGRWIEEINDYGEVTCWHCDKCYEDSGFITTCKWDFCPNCGAKKQEVEE